MARRGLLQFPRNRLPPRPHSRGEWCGRLIPLGVKTFRRDPITEVDYKASFLFNPSVSISPNTGTQRAFPGIPSLVCARGGAVGEIEYRRQLRYITADEHSRRLGAAGHPVSPVCCFTPSQANVFRGQPALLTEMGGPPPSGLSWGFNSRPRPPAQVRSGQSAE